MSIRSPPPALEPYLTLPPELSLTLITGTLGCSPTWLVTRHIASFLHPESPDEARAVILISWLRDLPFWKSEIRRTTGLDTSKHPSTFTFLDLLSSPSPDLPRTLPTSTQDPNTKTLLILDCPSLALTLSLTPQDLATQILHLRTQVHSTIIILPSDLPLISAATQSPEVRSTPLEVANAAFLTSQAHSARLVMSVRELETGAARDVSGVLRITRGGAWEDGEAEVKEAEFLYLVQRDGAAKVFERGSESGGA